MYLASVHAPSVPKLILIPYFPVEKNRQREDVTLKIRGQMWSQLAVDLWLVTTTRPLLTRATPIGGHPLILSAPLVTWAVDTAVSDLQWASDCSEIENSFEHASGLKLRVGSQILRDPNTHRPAHTYTYFLSNVGLLGLVQVYTAQIRQY